MKLAPEEQSQPSSPSQSSCAQPPLRLLPAHPQALQLLQPLQFVHPPQWRQLLLQQLLLQLLLPHPQPVQGLQGPQGPV